MTLVDWAVVIIMLASVIAGLAQGFFRSICSLGGLILGLAVAAWNYGRLASLLLPFLRIPAVASTVAFLLIALLVMAIVGVIGSLLAKAFKMIGLGWLDGIAGAIFGFFQGVLLVVVLILVIVAFFPEEHWLAESNLPRMFFGALHVSANVTPKDLSARVHTGLKSIEEQSEKWMHSGHI